MNDLRRQIESVRRELERIDGMMWSPARAAFNRGLSGGFDRQHVEQLNERIARAEGRDAIVRRLRVLERMRERQLAADSGADD